MDRMDNMDRRESKWAHREPRPPSWLRSERRAGTASRYLFVFRLNRMLDAGQGQY